LNILPSHVAGLLMRTSGSIYLGGKIPKLYPNYPEAEWAWLPPYKVSGVDSKWSEGYVSSFNTKSQIILTGEEETVINALKLIEYLQTPEVIVANINGIEGIDYNMVDGKMVLIPKSEQGDPIETWVKKPPVNTLEMFQQQSTKDAMSMGSSELQQRAINTLDKLYDEARIIPVIGSFMPTTIYDGYPDISSHKLYFSMMSKIIIGEEPIDAFDDYVEQWYATGGTEVTERAQQAAIDLGL